MWLCKTKVWKKSRVVLYRYRQSNCIHKKKHDIYKDIAKDVESRFNTSNYELDRRLSKEKNKKVVGLIKDELDKEVITKFLIVT